MAPGEGIGYVVPQRISRPGRCVISLRSSKRLVPAVLRVCAGESQILEKRLMFANPANLIKATLDIDEQTFRQGGELEVCLDE